MCKNIFYKDCCDKFIDYVKKSHNIEGNEVKSEKTAQDVQKNCLSLTELKDGAFYYTINGIEEAHFCEVNGVPELVMPELEEVLAPVPSFEEWQQMKAFCEEFNALKVAEENAKLKELLKECRNCVTRQIYGSSTRQYWEGIFDDILLTKIDEVLNVAKD